MAAIAFVGDSFCASYLAQDIVEHGWPPIQHGTLESTYLDIVARTNRYTLYPYGFGGKSWWYSRQRFVDDLQRIPKEIFEDQLEVIVFCHTNSGRINNAWNRELSNTDTTSPEIQYYYRNVFDGDFHDWAQQQWFKEIAERWSHIKTIHFHCFPESVKWSSLLPGVVYTTPLIHISIGELQGTEKEIYQIIQTDKRYNHFGLHNNQAMSECVLGAIYDYKPGLHEIDTSNFNIINRNAFRWPNAGFGTKK